MKRSVFGSFVEKAIEPSVPSSCSDNTHSYALSAGDSVVLVATKGGTHVPANPPGLAWSVALK
jgi:hypothetical protein